MLLAVRDAGGAEQADDQRGARHELADHPGQHGVARRRGQSDVELSRQANRLAAVAAMSGLLLQRDVAFQRLEVAGARILGNLADDARL